MRRQGRESAAQNLIPEMDYPKIGSKINSDLLASLPNDLWTGCLRTTKPLADWRFTLCERGNGVMDMSVVNDVVASSGRKQSEQKVALQVQKILEAHFPGYTVETGKSLLYKIEVDPSGQLSHESAASPTRGQNAFQTDILITKDSIPLVVIELKSGSFTSHDVITYSFKAARHKQIYPYLRYGFVVVGLDGLGRRFVTHNEGFDFAMAIPEIATIETDLVALVRRQIAGAETLCDLMRSDRIKILRYEETVEIDR